MPEKNGTPVLGARLEVGLFALIALVPFVVLLCKLSRYGLTFPYWDEWCLAPMIDSARSGQLGFLDLWSQHNEHRPLFPRLLMIGLASLSRWRVAWELVASVVMAIAYFGVLVRMSFRHSDSAHRPWALVPVLSFLVFSWSQMENWVWGWQIEWFLGALCVVGGISLLSSGLPQWPAFFLALCLGVVASLSMANGLLYWIAALPVVLWGRIPVPGADAREARQMLLIRILLWVALTLFILQMYMLEYKKPAVSPSFSILWTSPKAFAEYVLLYLGSPVVAIFSTPLWHGPEPPAPVWSQFIPGLMGCAALVFLLLRLFLKGGRVRYEIMPWLSLAAYAVGGGLLTGMGRAGLGAGHGLTSRYIGVSLLFWCALAGLSTLWVRETIGTTCCLGRKAAGRFLLVALVLLGTWGAATRNGKWEDLCRWKKMGWEAICYGFEDPLYLQDLCWDPEQLRLTFLPIMKEYGLCGIGNRPNPARAAAYLAEVPGFLKRGQFKAAEVYTKAAAFLDPSCPGLPEMQQQIQAELGGSR